MKTHRPWQPHMSNPPLFNPYAPITERASTLDHIEFIEDEAETGTSSEQSEEEREDTPSCMKRD
jgi:hypothetical protein